MNILKKIKQAITAPFTHGARKEIENEYQQALNNCNQYEQAELCKLYNQALEEHNKIESRRQELEQTYKAHSDQYEMERNEITLYLQETEQFIEETFDQIEKSFIFVKSSLYACVTGEMSIIERLFSKSKNIKDLFLTLRPLFIAADNNQVEILRLLCRNGADINERNGKNETAMDIARERGQVDADRILQEIAQETEIFWQGLRDQNEEQIKISLDRGAAYNSTEGGINILNHLIIDNKGYVPWKIKDYFVDKLELSQQYYSQAPKMEGLIGNPKDYFYINKSLPFCLDYTYKSNSHHYASFAEFNGSKQLFWVEPRSTNGYDLSSYHFSERVWYGHLKHYKELFQDEVLLQLFTLRTKNDQEFLYVLGQKHNGSLTLKRYEPKAEVIIECETNLVFSECYLKKEIEFELVSAHMPTDELFLFVKRRGALELFNYNIENSIWIKLPCHIANLSHHPLQIVSLYCGSENPQLFVFLSRYSSPDERQNELWSYDIASKKWISHSTYPKESYQRKIQVQKMKIEGEEHLIFLERYEMIHSTTGRLLSYHPEKRVLQEIGTCPDMWYYPVADLAKNNIVHFWVIPGFKQNSDIIIFLKQTNLAFQGFAFHPATKQGLILFNLPKQDYYDHLFLNDNHQKMYFSLELVQNEFKIIGFTASSLKNAKREIHYWSYPMNVLLLENKLQEKNKLQQDSDLIPYFISKDEHQSNLNYLTRITTATYSLLEAAKNGDWSLLMKSLREGADVTARGSQGYNALQLALNHPIDLATLKRLLESGVALNFRDNLQKKTVLELALGQSAYEVHDYVANLFNKQTLAALQNQQIEKDFIRFFKEIYLKHLGKIQRLLFDEPTIYADHHTDHLKRSQRVLMFCLLKSKKSSLLYTWPFMVILSKILSLPPSQVKKKIHFLNHINVIFAQSHSLYLALSEVGVQNYTLLKNAPLLSGLDWSYVVNSCLLNELVLKEQALKDEEAFQNIIKQHRDLFVNGIQAILLHLCKIVYQSDQLKLSQIRWIQNLTAWIIKELTQSPQSFRNQFKEYLKPYLNDYVIVAKNAFEDGLALLAPKRSIEPELKIISEQQSQMKENYQKTKDDFHREEAQLKNWLLKREQEYINLIQEISDQIKITKELDQNIEQQLQKAINEIKSYFSHFKQTLAENKHHSINRIQRKAFQGLVVMAGATIVAGVAAPILAGGIGASLSLSPVAVLTLETVLKGAMIGGINGAYAGNDVFKSTLKGAGLAYVGSQLGEVFGNVFGNVVNPMQNAIGESVYKLLALSLESVIKTKMEGGHVGKNLITQVGTELIFRASKLNSNAVVNGGIFNRADLQSLRDFQFINDLHDEVNRALVGGAISSFVNKKHFGRTVLTTAMEAFIRTSAELSVRHFSVKGKMQACEGELKKSSDIKKRKEFKNVSRVKQLKVSCNVHKSGCSCYEFFDRFTSNEKLKRNPYLESIIGDRIHDEIMGRLTDSEDPRAEEARESAIRNKNRYLYDLIGPKPYLEFRDKVIDEIFDYGDHNRPTDLYDLFMHIAKQESGFSFIKNAYADDVYTNNEMIKKVKLYAYKDISAINQMHTLENSVQSFATVPKKNEVYNEKYNKIFNEISINFALSRNNVNSTDFLTSLCKSPVLYHFLKSSINSIKLGLGDYLSAKHQKITFLVNTYNNSKTSIRDLNVTPVQALTCGAINTATEMTTSAVGNGCVLLSAGAFLESLSVCGPIGATLGIIGGGVILKEGTDFVEKSSALMGKASEKACHDTFDIGRKFFNSKKNSMQWGYIGKIVEKRSADKLIKLPENDDVITSSEYRSIANAFASLYNHAGLFGDLYPITTELKALQKMYAQCHRYENGDYYCDYVDARLIKTHFSSLSNLDVRSYNKNHGDRAAQIALSNTKPLVPLQDDVLREKAKSNPCVLFTPYLMKISNSYKDIGISTMFNHCKAMNEQRSVGNTSHQHQKSPELERNFDPEEMLRDMFGPYEIYVYP